MESIFVPVVDIRSLATDEKKNLKSWVNTCNNKKIIFLFIQNKVRAREVFEGIFDRSAWIQMFLSNYA